MNEILHLYWRAGFGLGPEEWIEKQNWNRSKAVKQLFKTANKTEQLFAVKENATANPAQMSKAEMAERRKQERRMVMLQNIDWVKRMSTETTNPLLERMTLFWHGHFACRTRNSKLAVQQLNAIRSHALGNFRDLLLAIAKDVSMIRFLNNQQNKKSSPNENFARELMELFSIGRGHYTEKDIKEAARAFTGWSSNLKGEYVFRTRQHDYGKKLFMGRSGNFDGADIIDMLLERKETAHFICGKIYRYFVNAKEDKAIVGQLANQFYNSGYEIAPLMRTIFESDWFYAPQNMGTKIKSPVELAAGIVRKLKVQFKNERALLFVQRALGQVLFDPPNVAGWAGGKSWIDNSTLMLRLNLSGYLINSGEVNFRVKEDLKAQTKNKAFGKLVATINLAPFHAILKGKSEQEIFDFTSQLLLQAPPGLDKRFVDRVAQSMKSDDYVKACLFTLMTLPEYQMC